MFGALRYPFYLTQELELQEKKTLNSILGSQYKRPLCGPIWALIINIVREISTLLRMADKENASRKRKQK